MTSMSSRVARSPVWAVLAVFLLVPAVVSAQPPLDAEKLCTPPATTIKQVVIDLASGEVDGTRRYKVEDDVRILFQNLNPFAFDYDVKVDAQELPEPAVEQFVLLTGLAALLEAGEEEAAGEEPAAELADAAAPTGTQDAAATPGFPVCTETTLRAALRTSGLEDRGVQLRCALDAVATARADAEKLLKELIVEVAKKDAALAGARVCRDVVHAVGGLLTVLKAEPVVASLKELDEELRQYRDLIGVVRQGMAEFEKQQLAEECEQDAIKSVLSPLSALAERADRHHASSLALLDQSRKAAAEITARSKAVREAVNAPDALWRTRTVGGFDVAHRVEVTVQHKKKDDKAFGESTLARAVLSFGGRQRFALALGAAGSGLDVTRFERIQGFELDRSGQLVLVNKEPNFTSVVGISEQSSYRLAPLVILHTRVHEGFWLFSGLHLSLGISGRVDDGLAAEYLAGISFSFAEERYFLTLGGYYGTQETLEGQLFPGAALPEELTDIPLRKERKWDFGLAMTVKVR